jgi:hypothetical protein
MVHSWSTVHSSTSCLLAHCRNENHRNAALAAFLRFADPNRAGCGEIRISVAADSHCATSTGCIGQLWSHSWPGRRKAQTEFLSPASISSGTGGIQSANLPRRTRRKRKIFRNRAKALAQPECGAPACRLWVPFATSGARNDAFRLSLHY